MTLQEAIKFFEGLKTEAIKKSEIKVYDQFLHILTELKKRDFSKNEIQFIEEELDSLNLGSNPENRKKFYRKALNKFKAYLKDAFSLITNGYYTSLGIGIGLAFGPVLGVLLGQFFERSLGISFGISIGIIIGLLAGQYLDSQAKAAGNII